MRLMNLCLWLSLSACSSTQLASATEGPGVSSTNIRLPTDGRVVALVGEMHFNVLQQAIELSTLADTNHDPIWLLINSPGGYVIAGNFLVNQMHAVRASGVELNCVVVGVAASMAFNILTECSHIYALRDTTFLFHPIREILRADTAVTEPQAKEMARSLAVDDRRWMRRLMHMLSGMPESIFRENYYNETYWYPDDLNEACGRIVIQIVDTIYGLPAKRLFKYPQQGPNSNEPAQLPHHLINRE